MGFRNFVNMPLHLFILHMNVINFHVDIYKSHVDMNKWGACSHNLSYMQQGTEVRHQGYHVNAESII